MRLPAALAILPFLIATACGAAPSAAPRAFDFAQLTAADTFTVERGFGFDLGTAPSAANPPFYFSVAVPEGNYRVTVTFGDAAAPSANTLKAESRQLLLESLATKPGQFETRTFAVSVRNASLPPPPQNAPGGTAVLLNPREVGLLRWDDKLTLEFNGTTPRIRSVEIAPAPAAPTIFLIGDSTVTDQPHEPAASWGQMLPRFLRTDVAVANHAESGETLKSFLSELRLAKVLSQTKPGDFLLIQFGHNDEKTQWPQTYVEARSTYKAYLRAFIAEARLRGVTPILVTSMQRRTFDEHDKIKNTHGDYPAAVRELAGEENVALVDLDRASVAFYEALGPSRAPLAFSAGGQDATHHNNYGAYQLAKCVAQALRDAGPELAALLSPDFEDFDPAHPDAPETFALPASPARSDAALRGN
ncbi:MAG TPA: rhamnogalacturonan acetylesterase [Opitutaceae bacterium]|nr:rhamnogalacturonan acetylesterase [Opitutaceae bacterium]